MNMLIEFETSLTYLSNGVVVAAYTTSSSSLGMYLPNWLQLNYTNTALRIQ